MKLDNSGNIIIGTTAILIVSILLLCIFITASVNYLENQNIQSQSNDNFKYIIDDYAANIEVLGRQSIDEAAQKVLGGWGLSDSPREIKKNLNNHLDEKNIQYGEKYDIKLSSEVLSVEPTDSPWKVLFKVRLNGQKDSERFSQIIERNASVEGLPDTLPTAKLSIFLGVHVIGDTIHYGKRRKYSKYRSY